MYNWFDIEDRFQHETIAQNIGQYCILIPLLVK